MTANFDLWYTTLLCPWNFPHDCGGSDDELSTNEAWGQQVCPHDQIENPALCAPNQHPQYESAPPSFRIKHALSMPVVDARTALGRTLAPSRLPRGMHA